MTAELTWIAAAQPSLMHAAAMFATGESLVDAELAAALAPIVADTDRELQQACAEPELFWASIVPWSAGLGDIAPRSTAQRLSACLAAGDFALDASELALRAGPLRAAWEARGPGLWRSLGRNLGEELQLDAKVILVRPALGGGGCVFVAQRCISFEAMLASPHRDLPEVVRLAWLRAQLQSGASPLALVPPLLAAAEDVELARCDLPTVETALAAWRLCTAADARTLAPQLIAGSPR